MGNIENETLSNLFRSTTNIAQFENFMQGLPQQLSSDASAPSGPAITNENIAQTGNSQDLQMTPVEDGQQIKINLPKRRPMAKINRNEDCPCGSGKKFKKCCGREA